MEKQTKLCRACDTIKSVSEFYKNNKTKDKLDYKCILCSKMKRLIPVKPKEKVERPKTGEHNFYSLSGVNAGSYKSMYELLALLGYDISNKDKSIHEQFVDRCNEKYNMNMKYKKRSKKEISRYLYDGSENPDYLQARKKL